MKTLEERLLHYVESKPGFNIDYVYDIVLENHKKAIFKLQHRIKERINFMLNSNESAIFLTFTFTDDFLPSKKEERKTSEYIHDFMLKNGVSQYVANSDYGKENGRFHWHAVVMTSKDIASNTWLYGAINFKRIPKSSIPLKLSRYLIKLQRHAVKVLDPLIMYHPKHFRKGGRDDE